MLVAALILNVGILLPVLWSIHTNSAGIKVALGPDTQARRILACVYCAIALTSVGLIALHAAEHVWALPMTLALFAVQASYKLGTLWAVGLGNPVTKTNLLVVLVQVIAVVSVTGSDLIPA